MNCLTLLIPLISQTPTGPSINYADAWSKAEHAIERSYYGRESRKDEMMARLKEFGPLASKATSEGEFRDIMDRMIAEFKDSHFDLLTNEDQGYFLMDGLASRTPASMPEFGAWFRREPSGYAVQMVLNGSEAERAGLMKGDIVSKVDGQPFSPIVALKPYVDKTVTLEIERGRETHDVDVKVESEPALAMFLDATKKSVRVIDDHGKKIGYIHLWTQANDSFKNEVSNAVYGPLRNTDAIILDLRDGFGGRPEGYADPFFRPGVILDWKFTKGDMKELFGYSKPLVVLINGGSRSAKEVLSFILKKSHRATLIGTNTARNVLGTTPQRLTDWAYIEIPIVEVYADGVRLEGLGVAPHIEVPQEFDSGGHDLYVQRAIGFLAGKL